MVVEDMQVAAARAIERGGGARSRRGRPPPRVASAEAAEKELDGGSSIGVSRCGRDRSRPERPGGGRRRIGGGPSLPGRGCPAAEAAAAVAAAAE